MRLSLLFFVVAAVALLSSSAAESADGVSHQLLRSASSPEVLRDLKAQRVDESDDSEDLTEERGGTNGVSTAAAKWKKIRTSVRLKELQEALAIAKMEVKAAAVAAAQAATKAKQMAAVTKYVDDVAIVKKMAHDATYRSGVYNAWHNMGIEPQTVFTTIAESGKYTAVKWDIIATGYLDHVTNIALAAAKKST